MCDSLLKRLRIYLDKKMFLLKYIIDRLGQNSKGVGKKNPYKIDIIEMGSKARYNKKEVRK